MKIKAFTLAEAMVMIGILGIITAVTIPTIVKKDFKTDTSVRAASKAYGALAQAVAGIVQDGYYYKNFDNDGFADNTQGIDTLTGKTYGGAGTNAREKFRDILLDTFHISNVSNISSSKTQFDTPDGVRWQLVWNSNTFESLEKPMLVFIDVNVKNGTDFGCRNLNQCRLIDTLVLLVHRNGNVVIDGVDTNPAVGVNSNGTLGSVPDYNDETFIKKIMGQYEETSTKSKYYQ